MNETAKSLTFAGIAAAALAGAYYAQSDATVVDVRQRVGQLLTENVAIDVPKRLRIARFDSQTAAVRRFEVAEVDGMWRIPSKEYYPADAAEQMAQAVQCLMGREILRIAGDAAESHEQFGVVDPLSAKLDSKSAGVGVRATMTDAKDAVLVDMIIGKAVKDEPNHRYVRRANQDVVYVIEIDPKQLTTSFADWIDHDLLQLDAADLREIFIDDYSAGLGISAGPDGQPFLEPVQKQRSEMTLVREDEGAPWTAAKVAKFDPSKDAMVDDVVAQGEEIDQEVVRNLVSGLDKLLIVDVARKPAGLSADLKAGDAILSKESSLTDLLEKGIMPGRQQSGADMVASEGEVQCTLSDGVEYVLRFGQLQVQTESAEGDESAAEPADAAAAAKPADGNTEAPADPAKPADQASDASKPDAAKKDDGKAKEGENLRRYLFVMARFDQDAIPKPKLQEVPPLPAGGDEAAADTPAEKPAEGAAGEEKKEGDDKPEEKPDAKPDDKSTELQKAIAQRTAIEEANKAETARYEKAVADGKKRVADLNERFGDWYYVISNDVFKQIHLGRDQVIHPKQTKSAEPGGAEDPLMGLPDLPGAIPGAAPGAGEPATNVPNPGEPNPDEPAADEPAAEEPAATTPPAAEPETESPAADASPAEDQQPAAADKAPAESPPAAAQQ